MASGKIDTHQHFFPKAYVEAVGMDVLAAQMPNKLAPDWSPERAIAMMDAAGIAEGILSVSSVPKIADPIRSASPATATTPPPRCASFIPAVSVPLPACRCRTSGPALPKQPTRWTR
jgi:6-methylsalicylate decarboxylase